MNNLQIPFNDLPTELQAYLANYLDQTKTIRRLQYEIEDLRQSMRTLLNRNEILRRNNTRLTLQVIEQLNTVRNLEFILANGLNDPEDREVARQLNFDVLSDSDYSDAETILEEEV